MGRPRSGEAPKAEGPTFLEPTFAGIVPRCTDLEAFKYWLHDQGVSKKKQANFCSDCRPEFKAQRIKEGRCENPEVSFREDQDGTLQGVIYRIPRRRTVSAGSEGVENRA